MSFGRLSEKLILTEHYHRDRTMKANNEFKKWNLPDVGHKNPSSVRVVSDKGDKLDEKFEQIKKEAYEQGYDAGLKKGEDHYRNNQDLLTNLLDQLSDSKSKIDEEVEAELLELVTKLTESIIDKKMDGDQSHLISVIHEAIECLPVNYNQIEIIASSQDHALIEQILSSSGIEGEKIKILDNNEIARGGFKILVNNTYIDGTIENKIKRLLGDTKT